MTNLRKEREATIIKIQSEGTQDSQRVRVLQRENAQLHLKIKGLMTEMDEVRAQREKIGTESESLVRVQAKQIAEHQSSIKSLEVSFYQRIVYWLDFLCDLILFSFDRISVQIRVTF